MAYASKDEVKSLFRDFAENSEAAVDDSDLDLFLDNTTAIIDSRFSELYQLPININDNPESFKILKQIQMFKVACIVDDILNDYAEADKKPGWCKKAEMLMKAYVPERENCKQCEPTMKLPDTPYLGTNEQKNRITISRTTGTVFKKGQDNW